MSTSQSAVSQLKSESTSRRGLDEWRSYWALPVASAFGYSTAVLHAYSLGPFIEPLQTAFAWSRAQISMGITIAGVVGALFSIPIGLLVDRLGPRPIGLTGVLLMTAAFALLGTATGSPSSFSAFAERTITGASRSK